MKVLSWIIALCGLWEAGDIVAPFVPGFGKVQAYVWNHIIIGILLVIAGVWAARTSNAGTRRTMQWIAVIAGAWLVIASFLLGNPFTAAGLWNDVIIGVIVFLLGIWAALTAQRAAG